LFLVSAILLLPASAVATTIGFLEPAGKDAPGNIAVTFDGGPRPANCTGTEGAAAPVCTVAPTVLEPELAAITFEFPAGFFAGLNQEIAGFAVVVESNQSQAAISDILALRLAVTTRTRPQLVLSFFSDTGETPLSLFGRTTIPPNFQFAVVEDGTIQPIPRNFFFAGSFDDPVAVGVPPQLDFVFRSDTEVPEPWSLVLLGSGMIGLMRHIRCRGSAFHRL